MQEHKENLRNSTSANPEQMSPSEKTETLEGLSTEKQTDQIRSVVENAGESAAENSSEDNQPFSEKAKNDYSGNASMVKKPVVKVSTAVPTIDVMIKETVEAVRQELKKNEAEMKTMLRNKKTTYYQINNQAKKIRFLNGILTQLKRAARLAEEFVVGLWRQYVKKS